MFRFTIRELVLLTLVVGMGAGWWLERLVLRNEVAALTARLSDSEYTHRQLFDAIERRGLTVMTVYNKTVLVGPFDCTLTSQTASPLP